MEPQMKKRIENVPRPRMQPGLGTKTAGAGDTAKQPICESNTTNCKVLDSNTRKYLSVRRVAQRFDISVNTVWRWVRNKKLPEPVKFSDKCTRWKESDLIDYEERTGVFTSSNSKGMRK